VTQVIQYLPRRCEALSSVSPKKKVVAFIPADFWFFVERRNGSGETIQIAVILKNPHFPSQVFC
jgi:hypothetical protein